MTTGFEISLVKLSLDVSIPEAVLVDIVQVTDEYGEAPQEPLRTSVHVPAGSTTRNVPAPAGSYVMTARPPAGEPMRQTPRLRRNQVLPIKFDLGRSPHEWLSWQTLYGNAPLEKDLTTEETEFLGRSGTRIEPELTIAAEDWPHPRFDSFGLVRTERPTWQDHRFALWRFRWNHFPANQFGGLARHEEPARRWWLRMQTPRGSLRAFLPAPWGMARGQEAEIEVLHDPARPADRSPISVLVRDSDAAALLAYLNARKMAEASASLEGRGMKTLILESMREKVRNPFLSAAAGYVALATPGMTSTRETWRPWIENLCNWFPWLPDGAIIHARLALQENKSSKAKARKCLELFKAAARRGPPCFSAGIPHLLSGLFHFAAEDREARELYNDLSRFAERVDPREPFLVCWEMRDLNERFRG